MKDIETAWAEDEFRSVDLGDQRRNQRLLLVAAGAARTAHGRINGVFANAAAREAAYRFVENRAIDAAAITAASAAAATKRSRGAISVVLDQSTISLRDPHQVRGLGRTSSGSTKRRGVEAMTGLALDDDRHVLGIVAQEWHVRSDERSPKAMHDLRPSFERESGLWIRAMSSSVSAIRAIRPDAPVTFVCDRGADVYGVFNAAKTLRVDVIVRSAYNRRLVDERSLHDVVKKAPVLGRVMRKVRIHGGDGSYKERVEAMSVRVAQVELQLRTAREQHDRGKVAVSIVYVRSRKSVSWLILTTKKIESIADAIDVIDTYCARWRIEEFHRAWKRGHCDVEETQLRSVGAIKRWGTILAAVAARAERLKTLSRTEPERPARDELSDDEIRALQLISKEKNHRPNDWALMTLGQATILIAYLGGWGGRSQGPPGATILGRGLERVENAAVVVRALREELP